VSPPPYVAVHVDGPRKVDCDVPQLDGSVVLQVGCPPVKVVYRVTCYRSASAAAI
jgi:hypothetical protein